MSYPQPSSSLYVVNGYEYFRLRTELSSPGDIYESEVGSHAIALGPESDLANVMVNYFDDQVPTFVQQTAVSPTRSFDGFIAARNDAQYAPAQRPGRIYFWAADLFDPNFRPTGFSAGSGDVMSFVAPVMDIIQYFTPLPSLVPQRIDKEFVFQNYNAVRTDYIVVPFYGRKFAYTCFTNRSPTDPATYQIIGVNYCITQNVAGSTPPPYHQQTQIVAAGTVDVNASVTEIITATNQGMFDALVFGVHATGPAPLRIITSDTI